MASLVDLHVLQNLTNTSVEVDLMNLSNANSNSVLCSVDSDCSQDEWCRSIAVAVYDEDLRSHHIECKPNESECVKYQVEGESCESYTLQCYFEWCHPDLRCFKDNPRIPDLPGTP